MGRYPHEKGHSDLLRPERRRSLFPVIGLPFPAGQNEGFYEWPSMHFSGIDLNLNLRKWRAADSGSAAIRMISAWAINVSAVFQTSPKPFRACGRFFSAMAKAVKLQPPPRGNAVLQQKLQYVRPAIRKRTCAGTFESPLRDLEPLHTNCRFSRVSKNPRAAGQQMAERSRR